jgi:intein/homing endonuclease
VQLVERFLVYCSAEYDAEPKETNADHIIDIAEKHFNAVRVRRFKDALEGDLESGKTEEALDRIASFDKLEMTAASGIDVFQDMDGLRQAFETNNTPMVEYPGALGEFCNVAFERDSFIAFYGPSKRGKCISEDAEIVLADGRIKTIKDIVRDQSSLDRVLSFNESTLRFEAAPIDEFWDNGKKPCWEVTTRTGRRVTTTKNHQYLTPDGWRYLQDLRPGGFIAVPKRIEAFGTTPVCENELKFLAYMLADGCCTQGWENKGEHRIKNGLRASFTKTDPVIVEDFSRTCASLGIKTVRKGITTDMRGDRTLIRKLGIGGHSSKTKSIPAFVFSCPKEQLSLFLRIFFSCDGGVHEEKSGMCISVTLANEMLLRQLSHLLLRFGVVHRLYYKPTKRDGRVFPAWRISIRSAECVNLFLREINFMSYKYREPITVEKRRCYLDVFPYQIAAKFLNELEAEYVDGKREVEHRGKGYYKRAGFAFREAFGKDTAASLRERIAKKLNTSRQRFAHMDGSAAHDKYMNADVLWDTIVSIKYVGMKQTYDLTETKNSNFIANDCIVHNTRWLTDFALLSVMQRNRTAYFQTGDLSEHQLRKRLAIRTARRPLQAGKIRVPTSIKVEGTNAVVEYEEREYPNGLDWKAAWESFEKIQAKHIKSRESYFKISVHPSLSITVKGIEEILEVWDRQGWSPDTVIIDYADVLAPVDSKKSTVDQTVETWRHLRGISQSRHCLLITASQTNAASFDAGILRKKHFSGSQLKFAEVTGCLGINEEEEERERQVQRLNWLAGREWDFVESRCVYCAGCPAIGNPRVLSSLGDQRR